jgi:magnesium-transporting ATPase (P-type)
MTILHVFFLEQRRHVAPAALHLRPIPPHVVRSEVSLPFVMLGAFAYFLKLPLAVIIRRVLTAVLASIPVALPATFTLASALGARVLAKLGVLPTRLSAVDEAASMDVLCADKTGMLTRNTLTTVHPSPMPNARRIGSLTMAGIIMGICVLAFCTGVLAVGRFGLNLGAGALRTLAFAVLVFGSQATIYAIRERRHLWGSRPSRSLAGSSIADILIASILAVDGIAMTPLPASVVLGTLAAAIAFAVILDFVKVPVFRRLGIAYGATRRRKDYG